MIVVTVCRTLFYQFFLLFVGLSVGFLLNAEYVGWKYPSIITSVRNTFFPIDFEDDGVLEWLYDQGQYKIFAFNRYPKDYKVIEQAMLAEEWYWCKALGEKSGTTDRQSDGIAFVRTLLVLQAIITNLFIVANIIRTWYG